MDKGERLSLAEAYAAAYVAVDELIRDLPAEALAFRPAVPGAWSINEHLVHLLDADAATWFRIRAAVAEPGKTIVTWEEEAWQARLEYAAMDGRACLETAKSLRTQALAGLKALAERDWSDFWILHPDRGRMELPALLSAYREHVAFHAPFVKRNREAWRAAKGIAT